MEYKTFIEGIYLMIDNMDSEEVKEFIKQSFKYIPSEEWDNILKIKFNNKSIKSSTFRRVLDEEYVQSSIKDINEWINAVNDGEISLWAKGYEDYSESYYGAFKWEYYDEDNIGSKLEEIVSFANECLDDRRYEVALSIMEQLMELQVYSNNDCEDELLLELNELIYEKIVSIDLNKLALNVLYCRYQVEEKSDRVEKLYQYFDYPYFKEVSIKDIFSIGNEKLQDKGAFLEEWIIHLKKTKGDLAVRLLKESIVYYKGVEDLYNEAKSCYNIHPSLYIEVLKDYESNHNYEDMITVGLEALDNVKSNLIIRSEIAIITSKAASILGKCDIEESCWYEAFISSTNVSNYLRLFNTKSSVDNYKLAVEKIINNIKEINSNKYAYDIKYELSENNIDETCYKYLQFFSGKFPVIKFYCKDTKNSIGWTGRFINVGVEMFLLYLYKDDSLGKGTAKILGDLAWNLGIQNKDRISILGKKDAKAIEKDFWSLFKKWKEEYKMTDSEKQDYINWIEIIINRRVEAIVSGKYRKKYSQVAMLIVALGEVKESMGNDGEKEFIIKKLLKKFPRHSALRAELDNL